VIFALKTGKMGKREYLKKKGSPRKEKGLKKRTKRNAALRTYI